MVAAAISLVLANSPVAEEVYQFWETHAGLFVDGFEFEQSLLHWVDDALMALFFFVVGLEIKREIVVGELSSVDKAMLPVVAAVGEETGDALVVLDIESGDERGRVATGSAEQVTFSSFTGKHPATLTREQVKALLIESGMWTALRGRPFGRVANPDGEPHSIFVTATDSNPLAPSVEVASRGRR